MTDPIDTIRARLLDIAEPGMTVLSIARRAAAIAGLDERDLLSRSREPHVCWVRFAVILAATRIASLAKIGRAIGRDHTTVMHGLKRARQLVQEDAAFAALVEVLTA